MNWVNQAKIFFGRGLVPMLIALIPIITIAYLLSAVGIVLKYPEFSANFFNPLFILFILMFIYLVGLLEGWFVTHIRTD